MAELGRMRAIRSKSLFAPLNAAAFIYSVGLGVEVLGAWILQRGPAILTGKFTEAPSLFTATLPTLRLRVGTKV